MQSLALLCFKWRLVTKRLAYASPVKRLISMQLAVVRMGVA